METKIAPISCFYCFSRNEELKSGSHTWLHVKRMAISWAKCKQSHSYRNQLIMNGVCLQFMKFSQPCNRLFDSCGACYLGVLSSDSNSLLYFQVRKMILAGGNDIDDAVTRMMRVAWGKDVCGEYNWTGKASADKPRVLRETEKHQSSSNQ
jgi:hypothetical protein